MLYGQLPFPPLELVSADKTSLLLTILFQMKISQKNWNKLGFSNLYYQIYILKKFYSY